MVVSSLCPDRAVSDRAGIITDFSFDPYGLDLDTDLAKNLDPVHHLVLTAGRTACESCFLPRDIKKRTGVILAAIALPTDTASAVSREMLCRKIPRPFTAMDALQTAMVSGPAAVLARALGLEGGSFTLDAACASALYAVKLACEHLNLGKADMMVAGGVSRPDALYTQIGFSQLSALSPSGRCAPFDRTADGLVVGEGCGIIVLKRLADALACHDPILGVIKGWGVSNDIDGNLVAPASEGQVRAMAGACDMADLSPDTIQYMECHGSGTPVGDKVELASISTILEKYPCYSRSLAIGSVKSNIGHLLTAAGAAGFIKTLLAMQAKTLPPSLHFTALPDNSPVDGTRVHVQTRASRWDPPAAGVPRTAAISAFGFGGINAHLLVEAYPPSRSQHAVPRMHTPVPPAPLKPVPPASLKFVPPASLKPVLPAPLNPVPPGPLKSAPPQKTGFAIVGMHTFTRECPDLAAFTNRVLGRVSPAPAPAAPRWRRRDHLPKNVQNMAADFLDTLSVGMGEFHIPPVQIKDILPQHLVVLKAAAGALTDAGIPIRPKENDLVRHRFGCAVGIGFDFGATDFSLRWNAHHLSDTMLDQLSPPLTFNRTLGALGGIAASRVARECRLGGPCFTVSANTASGIKALETGIHSLAAKETDIFLCAAVDMAGDIRQFSLHQGTDPAGPAIPAEGAGAVVIKRLDDALKDNDRIYSIITGISGSSGGSMAPENQQSASHIPQTPQSTAGPFLTAMEKGLADSGIHFSDLSFVDTSSGGYGRWGKEEAHALGQMAAKETLSGCTLGWTSLAPGDTQAASGMFSVIRTALCLFHRTLPPCPLPRDSLLHSLKKNGFVLHDTATPWPSPASGPRQAAASAMTDDGCAAICMLQQADCQASDKAPDQAPDQASNQTFDQTQGQTTDQASDLRPDPSSAALQPQPENTGYRETRNKASKNAQKPAPLVIPTTLPPLPQDLLEMLDPDPSVFGSPGGPQSIPGSRTVPALGNNPASETAPGSAPHPTSETIPASETTPALMDPKTVMETSAATARAHETFLALSRANMQKMQTQMSALVTAAAQETHKNTDSRNHSHTAPPVPARHQTKTVRPVPARDQTKTAPPVFTRDQCLEFATGKAGNVLGPAFAVLDTYPVRVRLPDEPLMLVDRIMHIAGEPLSLGPGKIITQHDVLPGAWYLDGGAAPVSISIEAGQADLFLCAWLGIDHVVKGLRRYRLLDAKVTFHRPLPKPGETIEYHISIDRFLRQGEVFLFFFHYQGFIDNRLFISMRDGCAGFFTEAEVEHSGGIVLKKQDRAVTAPAKPAEPAEPAKAAAPVSPFAPLVPVFPAAFHDDQVHYLRKGDLAGAFGPGFAGIRPGNAQHLPGGPMHLIDRVLSFDPFGGRFGMGTIIAEADIHPDAWFLTCHFIDDPVMPGTLMYECCAHALRIFVQRMGWVSPDDQVHFDVLPGNESDLKCRGPVTPETQKARYEIEIKQMGYMDADQTPFVIADAHMFADDLRIVLYRDMGMTLSGGSRDALNHLWSQT